MRKDDDELGFTFALSHDGLVSAVYVESKRPLTQEELLDALRYFIKKTESEEMDLFEIESETH